MPLIPLFHQLKSGLLGATFQGLVSLAGLSAIGVVLWHGGTLLAEGEMAFGALTSFMLYTFTVAFSIGALSSLRRLCESHGGHRSGI